MGESSDAYNVATAVSGIPIANGAVTIEVKDGNNTTCTASATITAPATCSGGGTNSCLHNLVLNADFENDWY